MSARSILARRRRSLDERVRSAVEDAIQPLIAVLGPPPGTLISREDAAKMLGVSVRKLDTLAADGDLHPVRIGRVVRYEPRALREFASRQARRKFA